MLDIHRIYMDALNNGVGRGVELSTPYKSDRRPDSERDGGVTRVEGDATFDVMDRRNRAWVLKSREWAIKNQKPGTAGV